MTALSKKRRAKLQAKLDKHHGYRHYEDDDIAVKEIKGCGLGVFAQRQFLPAELVIEIHGQLLRHDQYEGSTYVMEMDEQWYMEPAVPAAFLNHSCSPNCELVQLTKYTMGLVAICNVEPESQLTFDYGWQADDWIPECRCGAKNCRGWVVEKSQVKKMREFAKKREKKRNKAKSA
ncbi:SET domain-containing protein [Roseimaritima ulvae]|uniref:SET domain protein n=1 Tax=Roseimaritima ulvae TaxID=980254 RepID=A0A5B9R693_9BACT|nr:SET domain-containing protein-lysine N-methyltransferase [Roseimaritima ulvae]QEG42041.1 SET domain protein [Roseimaritima ulvae]